MDDSYSWTAAGSGDWGTPSNWFDVTTGQAAIAAPGSADVVAIDGPSTGAVTVTGPASVLGLAVNGGVTLAGNFAIGSFSLGIPQFFSYSPGTITSNIALTGTVIAQSVALGNFFEAPGDFGPIVHAAVVDIDPAAILSTGTFALTAGELQVDGGGLMTSGLLTLGSIVPFVLGLNGPLAVSGSLDVSNHASVHLDSLVIQDGTIELDATSTLEIGNAGTAAEGTVTVDPGAEVIVGNYFFPNALSVFSGPVLNNGSIIDNGSYNFSDVINNGTIDVRIATLGSISGAGQIIAGGGVTIGPGVSGTVDMEFGGLGLDISLGSGVTVAPTDTPYINDFGAGDSLVVQGVIADRAYYTPTGTAMGTLTLDRDGTPVASLALLGTYTADNFVVTSDSSGSTVTLNPPCYCRGTRILTDRGEAPVEELHIGDLVRTFSGSTQPIEWIGWRRVDCRRHPVPENVMPIRIAPGAFGENIPKRALLLSPDHSVYIDGVLIPIKYLVNGSTVMHVPMAEVTYYHVELPCHDLLLADGLPAESYLDVGDRSNFTNGGGLVTMHPNFSLDVACEAMWETAACAPLRIEGVEFDRVASRLRKRARLLGQRNDRKYSRPRTVKATDPMRLLDPIWYLANNDDVADAGVDAARHYRTWGRQEGRLPCPEIDLVRMLGLVDPGTVAFTMADVVVAGIDPVAHFCNIGWRERRRPNPYFDTAWYLDTHDVPAGMNPLLHYVLLGEPEGLPPSPHFDPAWYRQRYSIGPTVSPLAHYLTRRRSQRFSPLPAFDVTGYVQTHSATLRRNRDPYAHFLIAGQFAQIRREQAGRFAA